MGAPASAVELCEKMVVRARERRMSQAVEPLSIVDEQKNLSTMATGSVKAPWGNEVRGTPNILVRGALFGVVRTGPRDHCKQEQIYCASNYQITYTGERLDQGDLDIWQLAAHLCQRDLGKFVATSRKKMLQALGRGDGKENKLWLMRGLDRLVAGSVKLIELRSAVSAATDTGRPRGEPRQFNDNLLGYKMDGDMLSLRVSLDWAIFFMPDMYTLIDFERRLSLPLRAQLARWLHDFYSSHEDPFPYRVKTLRQMCGSKTADLHRFREALKEALDLLIKVRLLVNWMIDQNDLVTVKKIYLPRHNRS